jgi:predicted choloylglycine hydrolase
MSEINPTSYVFVNLKGSPYEIGRQQGNALKDIPGWVNFLTSNPAEWSSVFGQECFALYRQYCPGLEEEIHGLADTLGVAPERIIYHSMTYLFPPRCSHFVVSPQLTSTGRILVGRSYEFGPESEDKRLALTRPAGKFAHIGDSALLLGRLDGMNDQGLTVTMSAGGIPVGNLPGLQQPLQKGLQFWAVVRSLLENCRDVPEAIERVKDIPCAGNPILMLADKSGQAARVEIFGAKKAVTLLEDGGALWAANHFQSPEMKQHSEPAKANSIRRAENISRWINSHRGTIDPTAMKGLLSTLYPEGLCCHFYREYFGTMYSLVLDPAEDIFEICFGSPAVNPWHTFTFTETAPFKMFQASLPQAEGFADFWA